MGTKRSLICAVCNYKVFTSGGPDRGFRIQTNTYSCLDCQIIMDLVIVKGEFGLREKDFQDRNKIGEDQECRNCGGKNFELWDSKNKPCPKCSTRLEIDPNGMKMNWD